MSSGTTKRMIHLVSGWSKGLQLGNFVFKTCLNGCHADGTVMGSGDLKSNKGLATRLNISC